MKIPGSEKVIPAFKYVCVLAAALAIPYTAWADPVADYERGLASYRAGDVVGAMAPLRLAADAGHAPAQALYGTILDSAELDEEAVEYLRKAAEQNDPDGLYGLAKMYLAGEGVARDDAEAARLLRAAAAHGSDRAVLGLAMAYIVGNASLAAGDPTDPEASQWLLKAAELGDAASIEALVQAYRDGRFGLEPDAAQANEWAARLAKFRGEEKKVGGRKK